MISDPAAPHKLGLVDRMMKGLHDSGRTRCFVFAVSFEPGVVSVDRLAKRLDELIKIYPVLSARATPQDHWVPLEVTRTGSEIVHERSYVSSDDDSSADLLNRLGFETIQRAISDDGLDVSDGRTILVELHRPSNKTDHAQKDCLVVCADHTLSDGVGLNAFLQALVVSQLPDSIRNDSYAWPPAVETLIDYKLDEPATFPPPPVPEAWGMASKGRTLSSFAERYCHAELSPDQVKRLSATSKSNGIDTLSPILSAAWLRALWTVLDDPEDDIRVWQLKNDRIEIGRDKVPQMLGNYVIACPGHVFPAKSPDIWALARTMEDNLGPDNVAAGRKSLASIACAPVPFGKLLKMAAASPVPFRAGLAFSNLTRVPLPEGAEDLVWMSDVSPALAPINVHLIGHEKGLRLSVTIRDGFAISLVQGEEVNRLWKDILLHL